MVYQRLWSIQCYSFLSKKRIKRFFTMEGGKRGGPPGRRGKGGQEQKEASERASCDPNQAKFMSDLIVSLSMLKTKSRPKRKQVTLFISLEVFLIQKDLGS